MAGFSHHPNRRVILAYSSEITTMEDIGKEIQKEVSPINVLLTRTEYKPLPRNRLSSPS